MGAVDLAAEGGLVAAEPVAALGGTHVVRAPSIWRRIRRDAILLGAGNLATVAGQLAFRGILIAVLLPASYGRLSLVLAVYNTVWILGASGLPSAVARHIALTGPAQDAAVVKAAIRASIVPAAVAAIAVAAAAGLLLGSPVAGLFGGVGLVGLVYSLLAMGVLRGRGNMGAASAVMPASAVGEVAPLALLWLGGAHITVLLAFAAFCFGNLCGLATGGMLTLRTRPAQEGSRLGASAPRARELLGFSAWLAGATAGVAVLPLVTRAAASLDSYTVVALVDVAIVLLAVPQRIGTVILFAVVPHAARDSRSGGATVAISLRENLLVAVPFAAMAAVVAFTPAVGWAFGLVGRPAYGHGAPYIALALLASPARMLYGMVEGVLIAHGDGRFLAVNALGVAAIATVAIFAAVALGATIVAFAAFAAALWAIYLGGLWRMAALDAPQPRA